MQIVKYIIIIAISIIIGFIAGYLIRPVEKGVVVKEVKVTETKYKYIPNTCEEAQKCVQSNIKISVQDSESKKELKDNELYIKAEDDCKEAEAVVTIENTKKQNILLYIAGGFIIGALTILTIIAVL